jgi:hypothetical protein
VFRHRIRATTTGSSRISRRSYQDATLEWAKSNPEVAQQCLQPPPWDGFDKEFTEECISSLEKYCEWRGWHLPLSGADPTIDHHNAHLPINLVSHVLSAPLTLALFYREFYTSKDDSSTLKNPSSSFSWCCLGARAESTLPTDFWKEFLLLSSYVDSKINMKMDFVGPDVDPTTRDKRISWNDYHLNLSWRHKGLLHDLFDGQDLKWDAYVLLNPGVGHNYLLKDWQPTLEMILQEQMQPFTLFLSAHSELDARRDAKLFQEEYGLKVNYKPNPFASRITYKDPFAQDHFVQPNHYYAMVEIL